MTLIHKETSPFGDWIIFMNGVPLYKKWPDGRSMLFEKYGMPTTDVDRDNGRYGGMSSKTGENSAVNPFQQRSPEALEKMVATLLADICGSDELVARATRLFTVAFEAVYWKDHEELAAYSLAGLRDHFNLKTLIDLIDPSKYPTMPVEVRAPIREYLHTLPGFRPEMEYKQTQETFDWHARPEMDLTKLLDALQDKNDHLFPERPRLHVADDGYGTGKDGKSADVSSTWRSYLLGGSTSDEDAAASAELQTEEIPDDIIEVAGKLDFMRGGPTSLDIARVIFEERKRWQSEIERLRTAADYIAPYLRWTVGDESPGHHPTMPSAVAAFHVAFDIDTREKRMARSKKKVAEIVAAGKASRE